MLRTILHRLTLGLIATSVLFVLVDIVVVVLWIIHGITNGPQEEFTIGHILSPDTLATLGIVGTLVGAMAAKTATSLLMFVGNALLSAAEWCTAYGTKKRTSNSDTKK